MITDTESITCEKDEARIDEQLEVVVNSRILQQIERELQEEDSLEIARRGAFARI